MSEIKQVPKPEFVDVVKDGFRSMEEAECDGYLMKNACPDGYWTETHEKFKENVTCPECKKPVEIHGIAW